MFLLNLSLTKFHSVCFLVAISNCGDARLNGNAPSMWDHIISLKTGFKSTRHPFYSKDARRTEKNRDCETGNITNRCGLRTEQDMDVQRRVIKKSPEHQCLRLPSSEISKAGCTGRTEPQLSATEQRLSSGGATSQINPHTSLFDWNNFEPLCLFFLALIGFSIYSIKL